MPTDLKSILKIEVPVIVLITDHVLTGEEVRTLAPGAILELPKTTEDDLELLINNHGIGFGRAVKVGENFGIRITYVGDIKQRIEAMGVGSDPGGSGGSGGSQTQASDTKDEIDADTMAEEFLAGQ